MQNKSTKYAGRECVYPKDDGFAWKATMSGGGSGYFKPRRCPEQVQIDRQALYCGPRTPPFVGPFVTAVRCLLKVPQVGGKNAGVPDRQCVVNCAAFYAKLQECSATDCDARSITGSTPIAEYLATPSHPAFAVIKAAADAEAIPNRLYTSAMSGALLGKARAATGRVAPWHEGG